MDDRYNRFRSFSQVVFDGQFAALGLVLLAALAQLNAVLNSSEAQRNSQTFAEQQRSVFHTTDQSEQLLEDMGQRVSRPLQILRSTTETGQILDQYVPDLDASLLVTNRVHQQIGSDRDGSSGKRDLTSDDRLTAVLMRIRQPVKKNSSKHRNAIDDMFSGIE